MSISDKELSHRDKVLKQIVTTTIDTCYAKGVFNSCITCNNFNEQTELCKLNNLRPPARIIAAGCECYDDEIPF